MLLYCNGFWPGFKEETDGIHFGFFRHILQNVFNTYIQITDSIEHADILLETHFGQSILDLKTWNYSIFFSGEGVHGLPKNYETYTFILGGIDSGKNFIACPLFLAYEFCRPFNYQTNITAVPEKDILAVISASHVNSYREKIIDELEKKGYRIDFGGRYKNNLGQPVPGVWHTDEIRELQSKYKLVLSLENSNNEYYITEKIINPLRAGTVPIYYGSDKIGTFMNENRIVTIKENSLDDVLPEIDRLLTDKDYWLTKVNTSIFTAFSTNLIDRIINKMVQLLQNKRFVTEVIYNTKKEPERYHTLEPLLNYFNVRPNYTVWGEDTYNHMYFKKFLKTTTVPAISLAINTIACFEQYINSDKYLLIIESDCVPLTDFNSIEMKLNEVIRLMEHNNIDFVFLNKGHIQDLDLNNFGINVETNKCKINFQIKDITKYDNILYNTNCSRCTEAFIVSPNGLKEYINYFNTTDNHVPIDWDLNYFFYNTKIKSCWLVPELFRQYGYSGNIPHSRL
jgi:hypothetical protein